MSEESIFKAGEVCLYVGSIPNRGDIAYLDEVTLILRVHGTSPQLLQPHSHANEWGWVIDRRATVGSYSNLAWVAESNLRKKRPPSWDDIAATVGWRPCDRWAMDRLRELKQLHAIKKHLSSWPSVIDFPGRLP